MVQKELFLTCPPWQSVNISLLGSTIQNPVCSVWTPGQPNRVVKHQLGNLEGGDRWRNLIWSVWGEWQQRMGSSYLSSSLFSNRLLYLLNRGSGETAFCYLFQGRRCMSDTGATTFMATKKNGLGNGQTPQEQWKKHVQAQPAWQVPHSFTWLSETTSSQCQVPVKSTYFYYSIYTHSFWS